MTAFSNIELVRLIGDNDSISNNTQGICDGYFDYTVQSASVTVGQTYNLDINLGSCNTSFALVDVAKIFVDWNIDGDFNDYGEEVYLIGPSQSPSANSFSFAVPAFAIAGTTTMRVVSQSYLYNGSSTTFSACDNSAVVGATEDYTLNISSTTSTSYLWSTGDTTANINVSPLQTTNYWVDVNGCKDTITVTVLDTTVDLINITACDSYTWIDGNTYTASTATIASTYYVNAGSFYYLSLIHI